MQLLTKNNIPYICLILTLIFSGCKKEELTAEQWGERAVTKRKEIQALSENIACSQKSSVSVQTIQFDCMVQYFPIRNADLAKYEKLKAEYIDFTSKQYAAWYKQGLVVEPCSETLWATDQPIRLDCKDNKVYLLTAANLPVDEAKTLIIATKTELDNWAAAQSCTNEANWNYVRLVNHQSMAMEYIPFSTTTNYSELKAKVSLYNRLNLNVIEAEQKTRNFSNIKIVEKIECVNGKPVIKFRLGTNP